MPNLNDTRADIENLIGTAITPILPVSYDNVPFDESSIKNFVHLSLSFTNSENANIGAVLSKRIRHEGDIVFKLYVEIDSGTAIAFGLLDEIKTQVENRYICLNHLIHVLNAIHKAAFVYHQLDRFQNMLFGPFLS